MVNFFWSLFLISTTSILCEGYRILGVFPYLSKSHTILGYGIVKHLLEAGHESNLMLVAMWPTRMGTQSLVEAGFQVHLLEHTYRYLTADFQLEGLASQVTYITSVTEENNHSKLHQINVRNNFLQLPNDLVLKLIIEKKTLPQDHYYIMERTNALQAMTLKNEDVQKILLDPNEHYDLVIAEWLYSEICSGYAVVFDAPLVWVSGFEPHWMIMRLIGEHLNPAYNGDILLGNIAPFTFLQRIEELWLQIKISYYMYKHHDFEQRMEYDRLFAPVLLKKGKLLPSFDEVRYNGSLILGNSHASLGHATRLPQNFKQIAGFHIAKHVEPLPEALQNLMDKARNGVIYFSMGSIVKCKDMPDEVNQSLLKVFAGLNQTVLWKFEGNFSNVPQNVHIFKWLPQHSILSHPKCVLFITHGGLLSVIETIHFGVPIIGIPVFADQFANVNRAVQKGYAIKLDLSLKIAEDVKNAVGEIFRNRKYSDKAKESSLIYHDRTVGPGVELIHWVEHVIRTRGATHLRSAALLVPWYQKIYLDLAIIIIMLLFSVVFILKYFISLFISIRIRQSDKKNK